MLRRVLPALLCLLVLSRGPLAPAADAGNPAYADPQKTDADYPFQGEYSGEVQMDGQTLKVGVQVIALGDGAFDAVAYPGGLPGDGWMQPTKIRAAGKRSGEGAAALVKLAGKDDDGRDHAAEIRDGKLTVLGPDGKAVATLAKVERKSPTLGMKPPAGAVVIFDGEGPVKETETLVNPRLTDDGLLMEGVDSKNAYGDATWHVEFRLPYQPKDRGQGRGNSGCYVAGGYEVQMLDSFGLEGKDNECGGIYSAAAPRVNACFPPLTWQTYDIDYTAPKFEGDKKVANARMTVRHNGILIHENQEVRSATPGGPQPQEKPTGPLHLQNHGNPVRYRNIWVKPKS